MHLFRSDCLCSEGCSSTDSPPWLRSWPRRCCREPWAPPARDTPASPRLLARSAPAPAEPAAPPDSSYAPDTQTHLFSSAPEEPQRLRRLTPTRLFWSARYRTTMGRRYLEKANGIEGLFSWQKMAMCGICSMSSARTVGSEEQTAFHSNYKPRFISWRNKTWLHIHEQCWNMS